MRVCERERERERKRERLKKARGVKESVVFFVRACERFLLVSCSYLHMGRFLKRLIKVEVAVVVATSSAAVMAS